MQAGLQARGAGRKGGREICCMTAPGTAGRSRPRGREREKGAIHSHFPVPLTHSQHSLPSLAGREGGRQAGGSCRDSWLSVVAA